MIRLIGLVVILVVAVVAVVVLLGALFITRPGQHTAGDKVPGQIRNISFLALLLLSLGVSAGLISGI